MNKFHGDNRLEMQLYLYVAFVVLLGVFFLLHNAEFLNGDDCAVASHTASGIKFILQDYTIPETGRFYPMAFMMYNVLVDIGSYSITSHFVLHAIIYSILMIVFIVTCENVLKGNRLNTWVVLTLCALSTIMLSRTYEYFATTRYSIWVAYFLLTLWLFVTLKVHKRQSVLCSIIGLFIITYFCYCGEVFFIIPISYGTANLLFAWKKLSKLEKIYSFSMIATAILFLLLYYILVFSHMGSDVYDASHGSTDNLLVNAIKMFVAQKFLWVAFIIICFRSYKIFRGQTSYEWWDSLLLAGFGFYLGCGIMHLNHTVYFWTASICVTPAIVHYLQEYIGDKWTALAFVVLALIMCRKIPVVITDYNNERVSAKELWNVVEEQYEQNKVFYFYAPLSNDTISNNYQWRELCETRLGTLIAYKVHDNLFRFVRETQFDGSRGCWVLPNENDLLIPKSNSIVSSNGEILYSGNGVSIVDIK